MGLFDRITKSIVKAPSLPAGSVTMTEQQMKDMAGAIAQAYGNATPLPRNPWLSSVPFGPQNPIPAAPINPVNPLTGRAEPRRYEYQVAQNINVTETRFIPFKTLRAAAEQIDILRRCIELIKAKITSLEWDIVLADDASEKIIQSSDLDHIRAMAEARENFTEDIYRLRAFWENPDKANGLTFGDWLNIALEELLVIDALAIYPQMAVGGDLYGLQILDGATIKPMLDDRGMRPMAPNPAYQQILYGFPRSEFTANDDDPSADGEFTSDDLAYLVRNRRTTSVYGFSPTERALPLADIYLRRQQWLRAEFTDGVLPDMMFETDATWGTNPDLLRAFENIFNDDLAGQTEQRRRARILPAGIKPIMNDSNGEKFSDKIDMYLIDSICGHYGVQPTEIGYSPKGGLGGKGFEEGKAESAEFIGVEPIVNWINKAITNLSYTYLGMPRELEFKLMHSRRTDSKDSADKSDIELRGAVKTINERRSEMGLPLLDTPQADMPMLVTGADTYLFSSDGVISLASVASAPALEDDGITPIEGADTGEQPKPGVEATPENLNAEEASAEVKAFMKWAKRTDFTRQFTFNHIDPVVAEALNKCAFDGDMETAKALAKAYTS